MKLILIYYLLSCVQVRARVNSVRKFFKEISVIY